jgi:hypothetical protein
MTNEKSEEKNYELLKEALIEMTKEFPNDQILGSRIRYFADKIKSEDIILTVEALKKAPL